MDTNTQQHDDELIDKYLRNQLSREEEAAFEARLQTDAELRSRARFIALNIKALQSEEETTIPITDTYRRVAKNPNARNRKKR